ncbi:MAG: D-tyrosyl-tRNA(Tyr) deacylase [Flavobacteriales bacterium]|nr:D-tyrosyl-tRNA(Tyr) deacylase [Flavobacteriales bacterium]
MRVVLQRVLSASVSIEGEVYSTINEGYLILLGIENEDSKEDIEWLVRKICQLRLFNDEKGVMNLSLVETGREVLVVSQFTLFASSKKGNRPSYIRAARPETAIPLYENFLQSLKQQAPSEVRSGVFGADMKVKLLNDGPVTLLLDSKVRE